MSRLITRRDILRGSICAPLTIVVPGWLQWLSRWFEPKPDLRRIGFSIQENLRTMIFNPVAVQKLTPKRYAFAPIYTLSVATLPGLDAFRERRFKVAEGMPEEWCGIANLYGRNL